MLTEAEKEVLSDLLSSYEGFLALEGNHPSDVKDFTDAVHWIQNLVAFRVARRLQPEFWWQPTTTEARSPCPD